MPTHNAAIRLAIRTQQLPIMNFNWKSTFTLAAMRMVRNVYRSCDFKWPWPSTFWGENWHIGYVVPTTSLKSISMTFPDQINAFPWLLLYVQCPQKNKKSRCTNIYRGWAVWWGVFPSPVGVGPGEGAHPLPRTFLRFLPENGAFWLHFLPYARFSICLVYFCSSRIFSENKWLKIHDFSTILSIFHDFPWLAKIPLLSMTDDWP